MTGKNILLAPLDWGLGHATRCVPVVRKLMQNNRVLLGVTPLTKPIFDEEFPELEQITLPAYNIRYSVHFPLWLKLLSDWPRIHRVIQNENIGLDKIIRTHGLDTVISDNRFGLYSEKVHSVFITHQLFLKTPFAQTLAQSLNRKFILRFNEVWVPDYEHANESLAGELSHGEHYHKNVKYINPQSRLVAVAASEMEYDYLFLLSGPEPYHSELARKLLNEADGLPQQRFALCSHSFKEDTVKNVDLYFQPKSANLAQLISKSKTIVCRSGYSTLMDLHLLNKKEMILIPTPGQSEQEYLAEYWSQKNGAKFVNKSQNRLLPGLTR